MLKSLKTDLVLLDYFETSPSFKNLTVAFYQVAIDAKMWKAPTGGRDKIENVTDYTNSFHVFYVSISALPPEGASQMFTHF